MVGRYGSAVPELVPTCVWRITPGLITALDERFGEPVDAYVNGSQTWLRDDGPNGVPIEWRLHPVPGYHQPEGVTHHEVFAAVALAVASGETGEQLDPVRLWDGLEGFPAYGDEVEPAPLAVALSDALGLAPDATGLADHQAIADAWEHAGGHLSIIETLLAQLA